MAVVQHAKKAPTDGFTRTGMGEVSFILSAMVARGYSKLMLITTYTNGLCSGCFPEVFEMLELQSHRNARLRAGAL